MDTGQSHSVIWIMGPPGSGKTTLAASYLDARKLPCLWYQVDEGDADVSTFFHYMGLAAKKATSWSLSHLPCLTPEYHRGVSAFTLQYFEDLYDRLKPPFVLVFDNYQNAPPGSGFHDAIHGGLSVITEGIKVIITSRSEPPPVFARLRANGQMCFLGWDELRFTLEEFRGIVRMKGQKRLPVETLRQAHEKTDGWVAGLTLLLEESEQEEDAAVLFTDAQDWDGLVRLILGQAQSLILQGRNQTLQKWIEDIPGKIVENTPWLLYWLGVCCLQFKPAGCCRLFERAFQLFKTSQDEAGVFLSWAGVVNAIAHSGEGIKRIEPWFSRLKHLMRTMAFPAQGVFCFLQRTGKVCGSESRDVGTAWTNIASEGNGAWKPAGLLYYVHLASVCDCLPLWKGA